MTDKERPLNADAIYAALCWAESNAHRGGLTAEHVLAERINRPGEFIPSSPFNLTPEEIEAIYPGEPAGVNVGLTTWRQISVAPDMAVTFIKGGGPIGIAVRRFRADMAD